MKLYLAGPMTGYPELNFPLFHSEAARLRALGFEIVNPAELNAESDGDWLACMRVDIHALVDCDGVALIDGWEASEGASLEHEIAHRLGLAVFRAKSIRSPRNRPYGRPVNHWGVISPMEVAGEIKESFINGARG